MNITKVKNPIRNATARQIRIITSRTEISEGSGGKVSPQSTHWSTMIQSCLHCSCSLFTTDSLSFEEHPWLFDYHLLCGRLDISSLYNRVRCFRSLWIRDPPLVHEALEHASLLARFHRTILAHPLAEPLLFFHNGNNEKEHGHQTMLDELCADLLNANLESSIHLSKPPLHFIIEPLLGFFIWMLAIRKLLRKVPYSVIQIDKTPTGVGHKCLPHKSRSASYLSRKHWIDI